MQSAESLNSFFGVCFWSISHIGPLSKSSGKCFAQCFALCSSFKLTTRCWFVDKEHLIMDIVILDSCATPYWSGRLLRN